MITPLGTLYIVVAPSGAGKTSLVKALVDSMPNLYVSISYTTRPQRANEQEGINYHFIETERFQSMINDKLFLEYAQVFENYYGTSRQWVESYLQTDHDVILEIDWQGARQVQLEWPHSVGIFILPPSLQALEERLQARGQDSEEVILKRMKQAKQEISHYHELDYLVVNDCFATALADLQAIVRSRRSLRATQQVRHKQLLMELLA